MIRQTSGGARFGALNVAQQVHIAGPHLMDCSLPYDLWTHEAQLAATVYIIMDRTELDASVEMPRRIQAYNESNRRIGVTTRKFHTTLTEFQIRMTTLFVATLAPDTTSSRAYLKLLHSELAQPFFALNFYSRALLYSERAHREFVEPNREPLDAGTLRAFLQQAAA